MKVTNKHQFERMISLLEQHPEIGRGKGHFGSSKDDVKKTWERFAVELNSLGPPVRTSPEWQRVWIHYKANVKRKVSNNRRNVVATGGGASQEISLTPLEQSAADLIHINNAVNPTGRIFGTGRENSTLQTDENVENVLDQDAVEIIDSIEVLPSTPVPRQSRKRNAIEEKRLDAIETQTENHTKIVKILQKLEKTSAKNYDINKKMYELKKKQFEIRKKQADEVSELHKLNLELKKKEIEIVQRQLQGIL